jgi:SpoIID/LytB domain protein
MSKPMTSSSSFRGFRGVALLGAIVLVLILVVALAAAAAAADDDWEIDGGGWGHGIGLPQYGAQGMAGAGFSADEILGYYYSGARPRQVTSLLGPSHWINGKEALWIGLRNQQNLTSLEITATGGNLDVCLGESDDCGTPDAVIKPGAKWYFEKVSGGCRLREPATSTVLPDGDCSTDVKWVDDTNLNDLAGTTRVSVGGRSYSHGTLRLRPNTRDTGFHATLSISLEDYIYGVAEMSSSWHRTALEVQATIARSYAVATATGRSSSGAISSVRQSSCWCHLWATSSDQNYSGWQHEAETEAANAVWGKKWVAASKATTGDVLIHPSAANTIISTFYSASTGGATENNEDVWGGTPRPYLRSVPDPWSLPPYVTNPYATWTKTVSDAAMRSALGWDSVTRAEVIAGPPGTVVRLTGVDNGKSVTADRRGSWFRANFSVRSPYISGVHRSGPPPPTYERATPGPPPPSYERATPSRSD